MPNLSIIIPVYNVERYVEKCLRSCAEQDLSPDQYEIILINDGTKDNSLEIVKRVAKEYPNIKIFSQENSGLSAARNRGLELAKGKYIWFIDSDDWIEEDCLQEVFTNVKDKDVLAMGFIQAFDDESKNNIINYQKLDFETGSELLLDSYFPQAQLYVFRRAFLMDNKLFFYESIFHEDSEFTPRMLYFADKIKILKKPIYNFYKRPNSITTTPNPKRSFDCIKVAVSLSHFAESIPEKYKIKFDNLISVTVNNALSNTYYMDEITIKELNNYIYNNRSLFKHLINSNMMKYRLEGLLFRIFSRNTSLIYQIIQKMNRNAPKHNRI